MTGRSLVPMHSKGPAAGPWLRILLVLEEPRAGLTEIGRNADLTRVTLGQG